VLAVLVPGEVAAWLAIETTVIAGYQLLVVASHFACSPLSTAEQEAFTLRQQSIDPRAVSFARRRPFCDTGAITDR
jgi:hypothetical protein